MTTFKEAAQQPTSELGSHLPEGSTTGIAPELGNTCSKGEQVGDFQSQTITSFSL